MKLGADIRLNRISITNGHLDLKQNLFHVHLICHSQKFKILKKENDGQFSKLIKKQKIGNILKKKKKKRRNINQ